jgi:lipoprotein-anchoring transpeptidase ErfK/SrfK
MNHFSVLATTTALSLIAFSTQNALAVEADWDAIDQEIAATVADDPNEFEITDQDAPQILEDQIQDQPAAPNGASLRATSVLGSPVPATRNYNLNDSTEFLQSLGIDVKKKAPPAGSGITNPATNSSYRMTIEVFKRPSGLGIDKEFGITTVDGKIKRVFVISTAKAGKTTIEGQWELTPMGGYRNANPWKISRTYDNSPMYWGLQISGAYWIHSTPHYGQLGRPASMGCIRTTFPASMENWDDAVNNVKGSAKIIIYGRGSAAGIKSLQAKKAMYTGLTLGKILTSIEKDLSDAHAISKGEYYGRGHSRGGVKTANFKLCQNRTHDCRDLL